MWLAAQATGELKNTVTYSNVILYGCASYGGRQNMQLVLIILTYMAHAVPPYASYACSHWTVHRVPGVYLFIVCDCFPLTSDQWSCFVTYIYIWTAAKKHVWLTLAIVGKVYRLFGVLIGWHKSNKSLKWKTFHSDTGTLINILLSQD